MNHVAALFHSKPERERAKFKTLGDPVPGDADLGSGEHAVPMPVTEDRDPSLEKKTSRFETL